MKHYTSSWQSVVMMRIVMSCPAPSGSTLGNRVTARRWAGIFRTLGHDVAIAHPDAVMEGDLLIALHAKRSGAAAVRFRESFPDRPIVVALTGTDLYRDSPDDATVRRSLEIADRIVALQPHGPTLLDESHRRKAVVIAQSAIPAGTRRASSPWIDVALVGHLREEKDPFRGVEALRLLPDDSRVRIVHAGRPLDPSMEQRARAESGQRYEWLGELTTNAARDLIASSNLLLLTSVVEGGANVLSEAIVDHVPIIASRIPSTEAILGADYPGLFPPGETTSLAELLRRFEDDAELRRDLRKRVVALSPGFSPEREREAWQELLAELVVAPDAPGER